MTYTVASFYTPEYAGHAELLVASCERHGIPHHVEEIEPLGTWKANADHKPIWLLDALNSLRRPIMWVDADAVFRRPPDPLPFDEGARDVATCRFRWQGTGGFDTSRTNPETLSGCVWLADTAIVRDLLWRWAEVLQTEHPDWYDNRALHEAIETTPGVRFAELGLEYCHIEDVRVLHHKRPLVAHAVASRATLLRDASLPPEEIEEPYRAPYALLAKHHRRRPVINLERAP